MTKKQCVLYDRICIDCRECDTCDLDENKICDNCGKCINMPEGEYYEIIIDDIMNTDDQ